MLKVADITGFSRADHCPSGSDVESDISINCIIDTASWLIVSCGLEKVGIGLIFVVVIGRSVDVVFDMAMGGCSGVGKCSCFSTFP